MTKSSRRYERLLRRLEAFGVPYAVAGGMSLDAHGFRRLTVDVDILVTREGLKTIHEELEGLGYVPPFAGSKNLRDTEHGVRIEFLIAGEFPGTANPNQSRSRTQHESAWRSTEFGILSLPALVELKLASGMTNLGRLKDLADVQELIKALALPAEFADQLNPYVRDKYRELWQGIRDSPVGPGRKLKRIGVLRSFPKATRPSMENEFPLAFGLDT